MFRKKKPSVDPELLNGVIKSLQADESLYSFNHQFISADYRFSINFPMDPVEHELDGVEARIHQVGTPDSVVYSIIAYNVEGEPDKNAIANDVMDGITDAPNWHEYSNRELTTVDRGHTALTQTFISDENTLLINTTFYNEKYLYSIQVQNVYIEYAVTKLASFIDTFRFLPDRKSS